jgi:hypothetical protein
LLIIIANKQKGIDMSTDFDFITFDEGLERIQNAIKVVGAKDMEAGIITSRHPAADAFRKALSIELSNPGFQKWQLPVAFDGIGAQFFVTVAQPGAHVGEHSHDEGDGIRFIVSGSITHNGEELSAGDWMYIRKGAKYSMTVGHLGATMCYCYQCCCVPR